MRKAGAKSVIEELAGIQTPVIDAHIDLLSAAAGIDYRANGLTLARLGLDGMSPDDVRDYVAEGNPPEGAL